MPALLSRFHEPDYRPDAALTEWEHTVEDVELRLHPRTGLHLATIAGEYILGCTFVDGKPVVTDVHVRDLERRGCHWRHLSSDPHPLAQGICFALKEHFATELGRRDLLDSFEDAREALSE